MNCDHSGTTKPMPPGYLLLTIILMVVLHFLLPLQQFGWGGYRLLGVLPLVLGTTANLQADRVLKAAGTPVNPFAKTTTLITWGIYRHSRNPMYFGMVCVLSGICLFLGSLSPILVLVAFVWLIYHHFIKAEEAKLAGEFGEDWIAYAKITRRWI